jgi:hypothetical protein
MQVKTANTNHLWFLPLVWDFLLRVVIQGGLLVVLAVVVWTIIWLLVKALHGTFDPTAVSVGIFALFGLTFWGLSSAVVGDVLYLYAKALRANQQDRVLGGFGAVLTFFAFLIQLTLELTPN